MKRMFTVYILWCKHSLSMKWHHYLYLSLLNRIFISILFSNFLVLSWIGLLGNLQRGLILRKISSERKKISCLIQKIVKLYLKKMVNLARFLVLGLVLISSCLGYDQEVLTSELKEGILRLTHDIENNKVENNVLDYFPKEVEEVAPQIRKYFMGKQEGYSTSKVSCFEFPINNTY